MRPTPLRDASDESTYGGKAAKLADALRAGLPVPPGFALATTFVDAVASGVPEALDGLVLEFVSMPGPYAVRSSAVGEDGGNASFAGQHLTVLNVRQPEEAAPAVVRVYDSAQTAAARKYRQRLGLDETPRMAVVFQRMIEPTCAGVMFTRNPLNGADERVIEASWGLGEAVVAGLVVPDNFAVDRAGQLLRARPGDKSVALHSDAKGGTVEVELSRELATTPCLDQGQLELLNELASRCELRFGQGLDIEWGFVGRELYLLQCRAITRGR